MTDFEIVDTYTSNLQIKKSEALVGLQLVDVVLWLIKRNYEGKIPKGTYNAIDSLITCVLIRASFNIFSKTQLNFDVEEGKRLLMIREYSPEQLDSARVLLQDYENKKLKDINS